MTKQKVELDHAWTRDRVQWPGVFQFAPLTVMYVDGALSEAWRLNDGADVPLDQVDIPSDRGGKKI